MERLHIVENNAFPQLTAYKCPIISKTVQNETQF